MRVRERERDCVSHRIKRTREIRTGYKLPYHDEVVEEEEVERIDNNVMGKIFRVL